MVAFPAGRHHRIGNWGDSWVQPTISSGLNSLLAQHECHGNHIAPGYGWEANCSHVMGEKHMQGVVVDIITAKYDD